MRAALHGASMRDILSIFANDQIGRVLTMPQRFNAPSVSAAVRNFPRARWRWPATARPGGRDTAAARRRAARPGWPSGLWPIADDRWPVFWRRFDHDEDGEVALIVRFVDCRTTARVNAGGAGAPSTANAILSRRPINNGEMVPRRRTAWRPGKAGNAAGTAGRLQDLACSSSAEPTSLPGGDRQTDPESALGTADVGPRDVACR